MKTNKIQSQTFKIGEDYEIIYKNLNFSRKVFYLGERNGFFNFKTQGGNVIVLSSQDIVKDYHVKKWKEDSNDLT